MPNKAFKIALSNKDSISIFFQPSSECILTLDDTTSFHFRIRAGNNLEIQQHSKAPVTKTMTIENSIQKIEEITEETVSPDKDELLRACVNCHGKVYCISGGYACTPCGYISG
jgi:hypothetical protein